MSQTDSKPELSPEQKAAVEAIRARSKIERPGPDELIDKGELDELVPHGQFMELRELAVRLRQIRERQGLTLTDVSERSGITRAATSRLENGWNLNPTLDTLFRYATVLGGANQALRGRMPTATVRTGLTDHRGRHPRAGAAPASADPSTR